MCASYRKVANDSTMLFLSFMQVSMHTFIMQKQTFGTWPHQAHTAASFLLIDAGLNVMHLDHTNVFSIHSLSAMFKAHMLHTVK